MYPTIALQPGSTNTAAVKQLQDFLVSQGFMTPAQVQTGPGIYGPQTTAAVLAYQKARGVDYSSGPGYWGPKTIAIASSGGAAPSGGSTPISSTGGATPSSSTPYGPIYSDPVSGPQQNFSVNYDPTDISSMKAAISSLQQNAKTNADYELLNKISQQLGAETSRQGAITAKADQLMKSGAGSTAINDYYASLAPKDQLLVKNTFGSNLVSGYKPSTGNTQTTVVNKSGITTGGQLLPHYGQAEDLTGEGTAQADLLNAGITAAINKLVGISTLEEIYNDPLQQAFYIHAMEYGGYQVEDIIRDMKAVELRKTNPSIPQIISVDQPKATYYASAAGQTALAAIGSNPELSKISAANFPNEKYLSYGTNIPDEVFKTLVPINNPDSPEFKAAVEAVKSTAIDLSNALLDASTEQDRAFAQSQYDEFKKQVQEKYGITLSNDAIKAQEQLDNLGKDYSQAGLYGSGLYREALDDMLRSTKRSNEINRSSKLTEEEQKRAAYFRGYASAAEIAALTPEERQKYGLTASPDIINQFSLANLRSKYPDLSDRELQAMHDAVIDENNNFRSTIYQKKFQGINKNETDRTTSAIAKLDEIAANQELPAYAPYDLSEPLSKAPPSEITNMQTQLPPEKTQPSIVTPAPAPTSPANTNYQASIDAAMAAAKKIQEGINSLGTPSTSGTTTTPTATSTNTFTPTPTGYSFNTLPNGNVETYQNGQRISTGTASVARNYGYTG